MENDDYKWLFDNIKGLREKIRFKDRIEYRVSGELHNAFGPAVIGLGDDDKKTTGAVRYFLNGIEYTEEDWNIKTRSVKLKKIKKKISKNKEDLNGNNRE